VRVRVSAGEVDARLQVWDAREPIDAEFERAWRERLERCPHASFEFDPAFLRSQTRPDRAWRAALVEAPGVAGALVMRETGLDVVSGWPWRSHFAVEGDEVPVPGLTAAHCELAFALVQKLAGGRRVKVFTPEIASNGVPGAFRAGATFLQSLALTDAEQLARLDTNKRRMIKKAAAAGYTVHEASGGPHARAFAELQHGNAAAAGRGASAPDLDADLAPGTGWREWELPWMWLLVAVRDGVVHAGSGFGVSPAGTIDYRSNASTVEGRKGGANVLLGWEAMVRGRARGHRWLNWGGATAFKREFRGERVEMECRLGGGPVWSIPNQSEVWARRARPRVVAWLRAMTPKRGGASS
jgi:hypothetical protein